MSPDELEKVRELHAIACKDSVYYEHVELLLSHVSNLERINRALGTVVERQQTSADSAVRKLQYLLQNDDIKDRPASIGIHIEGAIKDLGAGT